MINVVANYQIMMNVMKNTTAKTSQLFASQLNGYNVIVVYSLQILTMYCAVLIVEE